MDVIKVKPLSVNEAYTGRRFCTNALSSYKNEIYYSLKQKNVPEGKLEINIDFGFSSKGSDIDNHVKCFLDVLQKKYGFNDNRVYKMTLTKQITKKGSEYIAFEIKPFEV